jgi:phosphate uptake regulator/aminoglycoside phosphotransferase
MQNIKNIEENFRFLILEVQNQIRETLNFIVNPSRKAYNKIISKDDYIDNLKNIIENECFSSINQTKFNQESINRLRSIHVMTINLERIADYCVNIVRQMEYLSSPKVLEILSYQEKMIEIVEYIGKIIEILDSKNLAGALAICRLEADLDEVYKKNFDKIMVQLRIGRSVEDHITALFIIRYMERIGDSILNIGEAILFSIIGEKIKIQQFEALQQTLSKSGVSGDVTEVDFHGIWGTRSGCRIAKVEDKETPQAKDSIFKEGNLQKIRQEKTNLECWTALFPGLVPRIFGYHEEEDNASLLTEFLPGCSLEEALFVADTEILHNALFILEQTLLEIWETTRKKHPLPIQIVRQIRERMAAVFQIHPEFHRSDVTLVDLKRLSFTQLLDQLEVLEKDCPAPFSVFTHGDFNTNNIIYNHATQKIHFIDVYRSKYDDYIQDASVFLVSNFRLPIFDEKSRERINYTITSFFKFIHNFAQKNNDEGFQLRLGIGVARSLFTSARFQLNKKFAKMMYYKSVYLMERLVESHANGISFIFPEAILLEQGWDI